MKKAVLVVVTVLSAAIAVSAAGTALSISIGTPEVTCPGATVTVPYTISSTAADAASVVERLTNTATNTVVSTRTYSILSGNVSGGWIFAGRSKTYDGTFQATGVADGDYVLEVCTTQAGSGGNPDKTNCQSTQVKVACADADNVCASVAPFGEVTGNAHISDNATAQIQFHGDFGPSATVEIDNSDGGVVGTAVIARNGDSCTYHASWKFTTGSGSDIYGNSGPGAYTVKVTGSNGATLEFGVVLN